ncbi:MAG: hypothetical protein IKC24_06655 [Oscillospiraceae bacterium]|nr:hypothetical protein [Oscillospiraceae bacterium]
MKLYGFLSAVFLCIRQFCLPNPFDALGEGVTIVWKGVPILLAPVLLNWIAEAFLHPITFGVVGIYYTRGSEPALGSILYMVFYAVHTGVLYLLCRAYPSTVLMILVLIGYIAMHALFIRLLNRADFM